MSMVRSLFLSFISLFFIAPVFAAHIDMDYLRHQVETLTGKRPIKVRRGGRENTYWLKERSTTPNRLMASWYLANEYTKLGFRTHIQKYRDFASRSNRYYTAQNVVAEMKSPHTSDFIVIGAHYDTVVGVPGANDNASSVAAGLAVAQALSKIPKSELKIGVRFIAFDEEEHGYHEGAQAYVEMLKKAGKLHTIKAMLNSELIGIPVFSSSDQYAGKSFMLVGDCSEGMQLGHPKWNNTAIVADRLEQVIQRSGLPLFISRECVKVSDQKAFMDAGLPATVTSFTRPMMMFDPSIPAAKCYHKPCDVTDDFNWSFYGMATEILYQFAASYAL